MLDSVFETATEIVQAVAYEVTPMVVGALDVNGVVERVDIQAIVERIDVERVIDRPQHVDGPSGSRPIARPS